MGYLTPTTWTGIDGTVYRIVSAVAVKANQPRWWLDIVPDDGDILAGPIKPSRLHRYPMGVTGRTNLPFALVEDIWEDLP